MKIKISVSITPALLKKLLALLPTFKTQKGWDRSEVICHALENFLAGGAK